MRGEVGHCGARRCWALRCEEKTAVFGRLGREETFGRLGREETMGAVWARGELFVRERGEIMLECVRARGEAVLSTAGVEEALKVCLWLWVQEAMNG